MDEYHLPVTFGEWLKQRRKALDLTQSELAQRAGCSIFTLRKIESGERRPSKQLARLLTRALEIEPGTEPTFLKVARGESNIERLGSPAPRQTNEPRYAHPPSPSPSNLPVPPNPLIGREQELSILGHFLRDPQCRLLTLIGTGGIGKTRLAIEVAAQNQDFFPDKVCFISLAALHSAAFITPAIADALGFNFHGQLDPHLQLLSYLRSKGTLLVLDNLEHLVDYAGQFADISECAPGVKLLVTSRERLNLPGEWVFEIQGLPIPPENKEKPIEAFSSVALFVQAARRAKATFELKENDRAAVIRICQVLEGMPLGIELAAAWVPVLSCKEIAQEIEHGLDFLETSMRHVPARQKSLRAAFEHSWHLLTGEEQGVLKRLAVFQGGFTRRAAGQVAGANLQTLQALSAKSLIRHLEDGRFSLHEVVRQYAYSHLAEDSRCEESLDRHCIYYLDLLKDLEKDIKSATQPETISYLSHEIDNLRAAWDRAIRKEMFSQLGQALRSYGWYHEIGGWLKDGIEQFEQVALALRGCTDHPLSQKVLGQALAQQGMLYFRLGFFDQAVERFEESLALLRPGGDPAALTDPLILLGIIQHLLGEVERAIGLIKEGLDCAQKAGDRWFIAYGNYNLGYLASLAGNYQAGYEQMLSALSLWREIGDPYSISIGLNYISPTAINLGYLDEAADYLKESLALSTLTGDRWGMGTAYRNSGLAALAQGNPLEAQRLIHKSLELFNGFTTGWDIARSMTFLGEAEAAAGDPEKARHTLLAALQQALEARADPLILDVLLALAKVTAGMGDLAQAEELSEFVLRHPASTQEAKDRASQLAAWMESTRGKHDAVQKESTLRLKPIAELAESILRRLEKPAGLHDPS